MISGYISQDTFESVCQKVASERGLSIEEVRQAAEKGFELQGVRIGIPLEEQVRQAQVRAGEMAVIENLRKKGLLSPEQEALFFGGSADG